MSSANISSTCATFSGPPKNAELFANLIPDELKACAHHLLETRRKQHLAPPPAMLGHLKISTRQPTRHRRGNPTATPPSSIANENVTRRNSEPSSCSAHPARGKGHHRAMGPALIEFITRNGREPYLEEEAGLIAISERDDANIADRPGTLGERLKAGGKPSSVSRDHTWTCLWPSRQHNRAPPNSPQVRSKPDAASRAKSGAPPGEANDPDFALAEQLAPTRSCSRRSPTRQRSTPTSPVTLWPEE